MNPSGIQIAPSSCPEPGIAQTCRVSMLLSGQIQRRWLVENPTEAPSGDQNTPSAPSEPGIVRSSNRSSERILSLPRLL